MHVSIVVRKADQSQSSLGLWSVHFGPDTFTYEGNGIYPDFSSLKSRLEEVARIVATDSRLAKWPGVCVTAENRASRKPNGWDANRHNRQAFAQVIPAA